MDSTQATQNSPAVKSPAVFLELGGIWIFGVLATLLLFFGTLNYFNILSLSNALPFFSFLPHQPLNSSAISEPISWYAGNKTILNWTMSAEGTVSKITDNAITITNQQSSLTILVNKGTMVQITLSKTGKPFLLRYDQHMVNIGDRMRVSFFGSPNTEPVALTIFRS